MRFTKVAEHRGYSILATDIEVPGGVAHVVPGIKEGPDKPTLATVQEAKDHIDYQLEWREARLGTFKETFEAEIFLHGGSMSVAVTKAARKMGLDAHDRVLVTLERLDARERTYQ